MGCTLLKLGGKVWGGIDHRLEVISWLPVKVQVLIIISIICVVCLFLIAKERGIRWVSEERSCSQ